ncbi:MAG: hypothetical protein H0X43_07730 [Nitrosospira sp.]|nr:hypothetical protein [Nitrosospira sp.]
MANMNSMVVAAALIPALFSCTVMELRQEVKSDESRVTSKEDELRIEEARQAQLQEEVKTLQQDLATRQMSLDDLEARLIELRKVNETTLAKTREEQGRKRQRETTLKKHQKAVTEIQQSGATIEEKKKRLEHLKGEIRKSLVLIEHS